MRKPFLFALLYGFAGPAYALDAVTAERELNAAAAELSALQQKIPDCESFLVAQQTQANKYSERARIENGSLVIKTDTEEKIFKEGSVLCGKGEGVSADTHLHLLVGLVPSLHLAIIQKTEVEWEEFLFLDLNTGRIWPSPNIAGKLSPDKKHLAFADYDESSMSLDGLTVFPLLSKGLGEPVHYADDRIACAPGTIGSLSSFSWKNNREIQLSYSVNNLDDTGPHNASCNIKVN